MTSPESFSLSHTDVCPEEPCNCGVAAAVAERAADSG